MPTDDELPRYEIALTDEAVYSYADVHPASVYERMGQLIDFLAEHPFYGEEYDPYYPAAMPPVSCRVFFCGRYGVYYHVDDGRRTITVLAIESTSMNPMGRFS